MARILECSRKCVRVADDTGADARNDGKHEISPGNLPAFMGMETLQQYHAEQGKAALHQRIPSSAFLPLACLSITTYKLSKSRTHARVIRRFVGALCEP